VLFKELEQKKKTSKEGGKEETTLLVLYCTAFAAALKKLVDRIT